MSAQPAAPLARLELAGGASLRVTAEGRLELESGDGRRASDELARLAAWPTPIVTCRARSGAAALVGLVRGDVLMLASVEDVALRRCSMGERIPNAEQLQIEAVAEGFLVIHENGVASIDETGRERWRLDRVCFDWRFVAEREGAIWLADHDGNLLGFDAASGFERP